MNPVRQLHEQAMDLAETAFAGNFYRNSPDHEHYKTPGEVKKLNRQACQLEKQAADMVEVGQEPTRGVLYRSAAWLAYHAGDLEEARRLVETGLAGNPPDWIKDELNDVLVAVKTGVIKK
jgi:hypothetical protein